MELPFDVYLLSLMDLKEVCMVAPVKQFLWHLTGEEIRAVSPNMPFEIELHEAAYGGSQKEICAVLGQEEFVICKGFINYQFLADREETMLHVYYANRWCHPCMDALGLKNNVKSGIVAAFNM